MKIFVNARFLTQPLTGVQRYGIECSRQIKKLQPDTVFVAPKNIMHNDLADELGATVIGRNTGHLWEQVDLPLYLTMRKRPPLLCLANTGPVVYSNNYFTLHDLAYYHHPEWNSKGFATWYNVLIPRLVLNCRHMFTVSETMREEIIRCYGVHPGKISVTYNGVPQHMLDETSHAPVKKEKIILSVGTFNRRKNHQNLIKAFLHSRLKDEYQLVLVGDKHKVFSEAGLDEKLIAENNIKIFKYLSQSELSGFYHRAQLVVSLSLYEGFGIPLLEGLYNGCKVVCSDIPVYHELYNDYAFFCDPLNITDIDAKLMQATADTGLYDIEPLLQKCNYERAARTILHNIK